VAARPSLMLFGIFLYFLLVVAVLALVCLPPLRDRATAGVSGLWRRSLARGTSWRRIGLQQTMRRAESVQDSGQRLERAVRRHWPALTTAALVILALPLGAALLRGVFRVDSFDPNASHAVDERVAALLKGEELVPPPALPPEVFMTAEVEQWQPLARSASRQWDLLDETFRQRLLLSFRLVHEQYGYDMVLIEGYRSPQRQAALAALGTSVTRAGPFESYHQFGLAADCAFLRDGRIVISEKDPWAMAGYERYGQVARSLGLVWGGDWHGLRDLGHVELHRPRALAADGDNRATEFPASR
jgi:peptidoglycan LD-endopeptidase CwlK